MNGKSSTINIYLYFEKISPSMKVLENPDHLAYLPATRNINQGNIRLKNQNCNLLNLRNKIDTIRLKLRNTIKYNKLYSEKVK